MKAGRLKEAISHFEEALRLRPEYGNAHYGLGVALAKEDRLPEAISQYEAALRIQYDPELQQLVLRLRAAGQ